MIHFDFLWALIALPLPLIIYWLPAKKQIQAAPLKMPTIIKGIQTQEYAPEKKKGSLVILSLIWLLVVLASTQPQWLGEAVNVPTEGIVLVVLKQHVEAQRAEVSDQ